MRVFTRSGILAAAFAGSMAAAGAVSAALIDFTDSSIYTTQTAASATGSSAGYSFTITGNSPSLSYDTGPGPVGGLAGDNDGIGIGNDEIGGPEFVTVTFDRKVRLTGVFFLDLFRAGQDDAEQASVYTGTPPGASAFVASFEATETYAPGGLGFGAFPVSAAGSTFTFDSGTGNDGVGVGDFALAGVEVAPIPVPAAALLLGTSLLGFRLLSRRRS